MEQKKQTALMRAIQRGKDTHNYYVDESLKDEYTDREKELLYVKSIALAEFINTLAELLPVEREQKIADWTAGNVNANLPSGDMLPKPMTAESYLNNTYTQE